MLDTKRVRCPFCQGKLTIRRKRIDNVRGFGKITKTYRRYLYCRACKRGVRIQKVWPPVGRR